MVTIFMMSAKIATPSLLKIRVFHGWSWFKFNNLELALGTNLKFYTSVAKGFELKARKFWGLIPTFGEVTEKKLVRGAFLPPTPIPSWIGLKKIFKSVKLCKIQIYLVFTSRHHFIFTDLKHWFFKFLAGYVNFKIFKIYMQYKQLCSFQIYI